MNECTSERGNFAKSSTIASRFAGMTRLSIVHVIYKPFISMSFLPDRSPPNPGDWRCLLRGGGGGRMYDGRGLRGRWPGRDCRCGGGGGIGSFCDRSASARFNSILSAEFTRQTDWQTEPHDQQSPSSWHLQFPFPGRVANASLANGRQKKKKVSKSCKWR